MRKPTFFSWLELMHENQIMHDEFKVNLRAKQRKQWTNIKTKNKIGCKCNEKEKKNYTLNMDILQK